MSQLARASVTVNSYPKPILTRIHEPGERPTPASIHLLQTEVCGNAVSIRSPYSIDNGMLIVATKEKAYQQLEDESVDRYNKRNNLTEDDDGFKLKTPYKFPEAPPLHETVPEGATGALTKKIEREHDEKVYAYRHLMQVHNELRNQILASADEMFFTELRHPMFRYGQVTVLELLEHLETNYGTANEDCIGPLKEAWTTPWTGGPIEELILQVNDGAHKLEVAGRHQSDKDKIDNLYSLISASGLLDKACQDWRFKSDSKKTWKNAVKHFTKYAIDEDNNKTSGSAGYTNEQANQVMTDLTLQLANVATENAERKAKEQIANSAIAELQAKIDSLSKKISPNNHYNNNNNSSDRGNGRTRGNRQNGGRRGPLRMTLNADGTVKYCSTHGCMNHNSNECRSPGPNHNNSATATNRMGGAPLQPTTE